MTDEIRDAVATVLTNVSNYPERAQLYLLGESLGPLIDRVTEAVRSVLAEQGDPAIGEEWIAYANITPSGIVLIEPRGLNYSTHHRTVKAGPWVQNEWEPVEENGAHP